MKEQNVIMVRRARVVPILLAVAAVTMGITQSAWWFLSVPLVAVGWMCAAPNLNLADGMLAYLAIFTGFILLKFHEQSGLAVLAGAAVSFYLCAIEMRVTAKPYDPDRLNTEEKPNK
ncbi:MAG: hypothetical protein PHG65_13470 [Kiritimatiellae bacterium]|nr:hypothetical protein [Kiritimatiellia bacterium]